MQEAKDKTDEERARLSRQRLFARFVGVCWLLLLLPLGTVIPRFRRGVFIPSDAWQHAWLGYAAGATLAGLALLGIVYVITVHYFILEGVRLPASPRKWLVAGYCGLALFTPLWGWAVEDGIVRNWLHSRDSDNRQFFMSATLLSHWQRSRGRRTASISEVALLENPEFGRFYLPLPEDRRAEWPDRGDTVTVTGEQSWVGVWFHDLELGKK